MANESSPVLIVGATGTTGRETLAATLRAGGNVRALVRSAKSASDLGPNVEIVLGDLRDGDSLARALRGVRAAFYVSPHEPDEELLAARFVRACESARVRVIFGGVHVEGGTRFSRGLKRWLFGRLFPHYAPKFRIGERMRRSSADPILLVPTNFFQNDELFREEILSGTFPQPFLRSLNRADVRDLGEAAARALLDPSLPSGAYSVVGPASLTAGECAEIWARALGRPVQCDPNGGAFAAAISRGLSGKKREDFIATYKVIRKLSLPTKPAQLAQTRALLGRSPTPYAAYVEATAARWMAERSLSARRSALG